MEAHALRRLDLSRDEFWNLTMREYSRSCAAAAGRDLDRYNRDVTQAWQTIAMLSKAFSSHGLRGLSSYLIREQVNTPTSRARERFEWDTFAAQHGLKRRHLSEAAKDALRRFKADEARNAAMAQEAIDSALRN
jgi:hypothetical protein